MRRGTTTIKAGFIKADGINRAMTPREMVRLSRLGRELRLTDQILADDFDTVEIVDRGPAPAWTTLDGDAVSFSMEQMPFPNSPLDVAVWLGTNAHELGHVLFSPRRNSRLMLRVIEAEQTYLRGIADLHNIVEDQRQERLILARFAPWRGYLTAALGHHLVGDNENAWLLMAGRTWLPDEIRSEAKRRFTAHYGADSMRELTEIIGDYQSLTDPGDSESDEAFALLERLVGVFGLSVPPLKNKCVVMASGDPDTSQPGHAAPPTANESDPDEESDGPAIGDDQEGDQADSDGQADPAADSQLSDPASGAGSGTSQAPMKDQLQDAAKRQIAENDSTNDDLAAVLTTLNHGKAGSDEDVEPTRGKYHGVTDRARRLHHEVGDALLDLKDASEPGWVKRTDSGRLNVRRLANPNVDPDQLFDRYEPGQMDASEMEVVLLLDVSGSMSSHIHRLAEAAWAISHSVDDLEGRCTVFTYDTTHFIMSTADQRPDERMFVPDALGGTDPATGLLDAYQLLSGSSARNRLMVILTDGSWSYGDERAHRLIDSMNDDGMTTVIALLGQEAGTGLHHCQYGAKIDDPTDLARLFQTVAAAKIGAW